MKTSADVYRAVNVVSKVFLWCFIIGVVFVLGWGGCFLWFRDVGYQIHSAIFDVSKHEFNVMHFYGMTFVKVCIFWFFLVPYVAIRLAMVGTGDADDAKA